MQQLNDLRQIPVPIQMTLQLFPYNRMSIQRVIIRTERQLENLLRGIPRHRNHRTLIRTVTENQFTIIIRFDAEYIIQIIFFIAQIQIFAQIVHDRVQVDDLRPIV